ncbi:MAG: glutathione S-transferase family protein [Bermanella sp.]
MTSKLTLISHVLCPYVQRAAIVLIEKDIPFEREYIDLANKPNWFKTISPLGKTPVLLAEETPIFESMVICEYLEEIANPKLHPSNPINKAQHRAWIEFGSSILNDIGALYNAVNETIFNEKSQQIKNKFSQLENVLKDGPYFSGESFTLVDAAFGPVFRYFEVFNTFYEGGWFNDFPKLENWKNNLMKRPSIQQAVSADYEKNLLVFLQKRHSYMSNFLQGDLVL